GVAAEFGFELDGVGQIGGGAIHVADRSEKLVAVDQAFEIGAAGDLFGDRGNLRAVGLAIIDLPGDHDAGARFVQVRHVDDDDKGRHQDDDRDEGDQHRPPPQDVEQVG